MTEQEDDSTRQLVEEFGNLDMFDKEFSINWNQLKLTEQEMEARRQWDNHRMAFVREKLPGLGSMAIVNSQEELLRNYVVPPAFAAGQEASVRSKFDEPRSNFYPPQLAPWEDFESSCTEEVFSNRQMDVPVSSSQGFSIMKNITMVDEADEHSFLKYAVFSALQECGLMVGLLTEETADSRGVVPIGRPDDVGVHGTETRVTSVIEVKSSQNLLIPNAVQNVCDRYNEAFKNQIETRSEDRSLEWSRIGHPLAQMLGYMIDNNVFYGALCSASKTYFVRLVFTENDNDDADDNNNSTIGVEITKAYITCAMNYLRSWAYFFRLSNRDRSHDGINLKAELTKLTNNPWEFRTPLGQIRTRSRATAKTAKGDDDHDDDDDNDDDHDDDNDDDDDRDRKNKKSRGQSIRKGIKGFFGKKRGRRGDDGSKKKAKGSIGDGKNKASSTMVCRQESARPPPLVRYETPSGPYQIDFFEFERGFVDYAEYEDLKCKTYIAHGRNGVVFSARINGDEYAVKQFDLSKNFSGYEREIRAYKHLRDAWGKLVPTPHFISASPTGNVRFLVMTKGVDPKDFTMEAVQELTIKLITEFNFRHLDNSHGRNYIAVNGKLMMIDFEAWENLAEKEESSVGS